jgi:hypothetical protein
MNADDTAGSDDMEVAYAMSAHILCENICGVAHTAISKSVPDVGSAVFEHPETCSCGA